ncbi:hypothetical protein ABIF27_002311 [Bradyrhizobium elkanii]
MSVFGYFEIALRQPQQQPAVVCLTNHCVDATPERLYRSIWSFTTLDLRNTMRQLFDGKVAHWSKRTLSFTSINAIS